MNSTQKKQATLPSELEGNTLDKMAIGEVRYTTPWGMWVDDNRHCWLHPKYPANSRPEGTSEMRVELREDGYHVWAPRGKTWDIQTESSYASPRDTEFIPVAELHL